MTFTNLDGDVDREYHYVIDAFSVDVSYDFRITFNGDTASNYSWSFEQYPNGDSSSASDTAIRTLPAIYGRSGVSGIIYALTGDDRHVIYNGGYTGAGGTTRSASCGNGSWHNTVSNITSIAFTASSANNLLACIKTRTKIIKNHYYNVMIPAIKACTTQAELDAIDIAIGWPE
jgi:hypothetical protein